MAPPPHPPSSPHPAKAEAEDSEHLLDLLQQAETISGLLGHNFGGDGSFDEPSAAPGLHGMVQCVADLLIAAKAHAVGPEVPKAAQAAILYASSLAEHLDAQSRDDLHDGERGFRLGDRYLSMCYWTVEKLALRAYESLTTAEVQQ
ncbi:hypothetical protein [Variovorax boronicumulans]|uniref:hypothetical protein n=1 Tax=Variovorax boronicumulans TaxID=436515 RepID=UPI00142E058C|nr:hypothetical protein [Variovorax boronicumulans]